MESQHLQRINSEIDTRVVAIRAQHADWPCAKGCDTCCRQLAHLPRLSAAEWDALRPALAALDPAQLAQIAGRLAALADDPAGPLTCPLLDAASGACPVYTQRPVACRSYGFYVQRERGVYCPAIESRVADGSFDDVVWGNHDAIDRDLAGCGRTRTLAAWFDDWRSTGTTRQE